jgi:DNA-directed RNA polymerase specialized sigma subunit
MVRSHPRESPQRESACRSLVARYQWLVTACVRRYRSSPETVEDLTQVGYLGLNYLRTAIQGEPAGHIDP